MTPVRRHAVFTFENTRQVLAAETIFRQAGIRHEEVPPPRDVQSGCAVAVRIALNDLVMAVEALAQKDAPWEAVYELGVLGEVVAKLG